MVILVIRGLSVGDLKWNGESRTQQSASSAVSSGAFSKGPASSSLILSV